MASFARAISTRRNKPHDIEISNPLFISRAASQRGGRPVLRAQISSPTALISTSNAQVYQAHSIAGRSPIEIRNVSSGSSATSSSGEDSDASNGSIHSRDTVTDASSVDESPVTTEPDYNHLTTYFKPSVDTQSPTSPTSSTRPSLDTPRIPQRAPSHSKKAHEGLHRKRSIQRMLSPPPSRGKEMARSSADIFSPPQTSIVEVPRENPFGKELAQLDAVAEEFGQVVKNAERDADEVYMENRNLARYSASDYMFEIQGFIHDMFRDEQQAEFEFGFF